MSCDVVKAFWNHVLSAGSSELEIPSEGKKVMKDRAAHIYAISDCNRPYTDIVEKGGTWTMEDYLHWTETNCTYICMDILKPHDSCQGILPPMWAKLRNGILFYTRCDPLTGVPHKLLEGNKAIWQFSQMEQQHMEP